MKLTRRFATMRCRNCDQTKRIRLLIELAVQIGTDGTCRLPTWSIGLECPLCASTDVDADAASLLDTAVKSEVY